MDMVEPGEGYMEKGLKNKEKGGLKLKEIIQKLREVYPRVSLSGLAQLEGRLVQGFRKDLF